MEGFNHQNAIFELTIDAEEHGQSVPPWFIVNFHPAFGMGAVFKCFRMELLEAGACSPDGKPGS